MGYIGVYITIHHPLACGGISIRQRVGLMSGRCWARVWTTLHHTIDVKNSNFCCYFRRMISLVRVGGMPWPDETHLGLTDKGRKQFRQTTTIFFTLLRPTLKTKHLTFNYAKMYKNIIFLYLKQRTHLHYRRCDVQYKI